MRSSATPLSAAPPSSRKPRTADGGGDDGGSAHDSVGAGRGVARQRAAARSARSGGISDDEDDDDDAPLHGCATPPPRDEADDEYFASDDRPLSGMKLKPLFPLSRYSRRRRLFARARRCGRGARRLETTRRGRRRRLQPRPNDSTTELPRGGRRVRARCARRGRRWRTPSRTRAPRPSSAHARTAAAVRWRGPRQNGTPTCRGPAGEVDLRDGAAGGAGDATTALDPSLAGLTLRAETARRGASRAELARRTRRCRARAGIGASRPRRSTSSRRSRARRHAAGRPDAAAAAAAASPGRRAGGLGDAVEGAAARLGAVLEAGLLVQFESLLSTYGDELSMLADVHAAVKALRRTRVVLVAPARGGVAEWGRVELKRVDEDTATAATAAARPLAPEAPPLELRVSCASAAVWAALPLSARSGALTAIRVVPVLFSQGINEMQSVAHTLAPALCKLQDRANVEAAAAVADHYERYSRFWAPESRAVADAIAAAAEPAPTGGAAAPVVAAPAAPPPRATTVRSGAAFDARLDAALRDLARDGRGGARPAARRVLRRRALRAARRRAGCRARRRGRGRRRRRVGRAPDAACARGRAFAAAAPRARAGRARRGARCAPCERRRETRRVAADVVGRRRRRGRCAERRPRKWAAATRARATTRAYDAR